MRENVSRGGRTSGFSGQGGQPMGSDCRRDSRTMPGGSSPPCCPGDLSRTSGGTPGETRTSNPQTCWWMGLCRRTTRAQCDHRPLRRASAAARKSLWLDWDLGRRRAAGTRGAEAISKGPLSQLRAEDRPVGGGYLERGREKSHSPRRMVGCQLATGAAHGAMQIEQKRESAQ